MAAQRLHPLPGMAPVKPAYGITTPSISSGPSDQEKRLDIKLKLMNRGVSGPDAEALTADAQKLSGKDLDAEIARLSTLADDPAALKKATDKLHQKGGGAGSGSGDSYQAQKKNGPPIKVTPPVDAKTAMTGAATGAAKTLAKPLGDKVAAECKKEPGVCVAAGGTGTLIAAGAAAGKLYATGGTVGGTVPAGNTELSAKVTTEKKLAKPTAEVGVKQKFDLPKDSSLTLGGKVGGGYDGLDSAGGSILWQKKLTGGGSLSAGASGSTGKDGPSGKGEFSFQPKSTSPKISGTVEASQKEKKGFVTLDIPF
jgi:hypothetical protein